MTTRTRILAAALAALALVSGNAEAQRHGGYRGGYHGGHGGYYHRGGWGPGPLWGGIGLGLGIGIGSYYLTRPDYVVVDSSPTVVYAPPPVTVQTTPQPVPRAAAPAQPDPIFYPRNGQSSAQTEADRQECNRWATAQPSAMADASVFHRATLACMDGRGYTSR